MLLKCTLQIDQGFNYHSFFFFLLGSLTFAHNLLALPKHHFIQHMHKI